LRKEGTQEVEEEAAEPLFPDDAAVRCGPSTIPAAFAGRISRGIRLGATGRRLGQLSLAISTSNRSGTSTTRLNRHLRSHNAFSDLRRHPRLQVELHPPQPVRLAAFDDLQRLQTTERVIGCAEPARNRLGIDQFAKRGDESPSFSQLPADWTRSAANRIPAVQGTYTLQSRFRAIVWLGN
jgi:hypothetical protein